MATDVHQVRCFVAVAEESHFGRAAERLHLTPSPVSRAVKDLERELGAELFIRRYHQVELTPAGEQVLARARALLADFDDLRNVARAASRGAPRVIHIGGTHLAPPALFDKVVELADVTDRTFAITSPKVHPPAMNRMYQYLADAGITRLHRLADSDTALLASYVRRGHSLALTLAPATGGAFRVFDDPAFTLVPLRDDALEFTVSVAWRRDRAESDGDVAALVAAARRTWPGGPDLI